ncbi:MAG: prepilin-type N-terminal cleavage/methylation domain-containing protein [Bacteroidota bacterium]
MKNTKKLKGMTLTELLVVLAILGVLLLLAFPVVKPLFAKTYAMEAKQNLKHLAELQKVHYLEHMKYSDEFYAVGFETAPLVSQENGTAHYQIEILKAGRDDFFARATSITDFDGDGSFNVWEIDKQGIPREVVPD